MTSNRRNHAGGHKLRTLSTRTRTPRVEAGGRILLILTDHGNPIGRRSLHIATMSARSLRTLEFNLSHFSRSDSEEVRPLYPSRTVAPSRNLASPNSGLWRTTYSSKWRWGQTPHVSALGIYLSGTIRRMPPNQQWSKRMIKEFRRLQDPRARQHHQSIQHSPLLSDLVRTDRNSGSGVAVVGSSSDLSYSYSPSQGVAEGEVPQSEPAEAMEIPTRAGTAPAQ